MGRIDDGIMLVLCNGPMYCIVIITVDSRHVTAREQETRLNKYILSIDTDFAVLTK